MLAGAALLAVAAALAVLARDAWQWQERLDSGDARFHATQAGRDPWERERGPLSIPAGLVGVEDDLAFRRALLLVRRSHDVNADVDAWQLLRLQGEAESALHRVEESDADPVRRAAAANLLGVLLYEDSLATRSNTRSFLRRSFAAFRRAIRTDPTNADAKFNLELLYSVAPPQSKRRRGGGSSRRGAMRSGGNAPGSGY